MLTRCVLKSNVPVVRLLFGERLSKRTSFFENFTLNIPGGNCPACPVCAPMFHCWQVFSMKHAVWLIRFGRLDAANFE
jgi:hypothetical protein